MQLEEAKKAQSEYLIETQKKREVAVRKKIKEHKTVSTPQIWVIFKYCHYDEIYNYR